MFHKSRTAPTTAEQHVTVTTPNPVLTAGTALATPPSPEKAVAEGVAAARAGLLDPEWGPDNVALTMPRLFEKESDVATHLVAVDFGRQLADLHAEGRAAVASFEALDADSPRVLGSLRQAHHDVHEAREHGRALGLTTRVGESRPQPWPTKVGIGVVSAVIVAADTAITAPAFDNLGLSDQPLIGHITWTDERHLAAFGLIFALLFACHVLGHTLVRAASYTSHRLSKDHARHTEHSTPTASPAHTKE